MCNNITLFFDWYASTRTKRDVLKNDILFIATFSLNYYTSCRVIRDEKPIDEGNVAKSTITEPRIAMDKSRYGKSLQCAMRLAFSSLRKSSSWLATVIQLLVRKHSQDTGRQRAIALKSLAVGFVVRENVFRCLLFFHLPSAECIFDQTSLREKRRNKVAIRHVVIRKPEDCVIITHPSW